MRKAVGVNPFVTLLALFAFSALLAYRRGFDGHSPGGHHSNLAQPLCFPAGARWSQRFRPGVTMPAGCVKKPKIWPKIYASRPGLTPGGSEEQVKQTEQMMNEIETLAADLDRLLAQVHSAEGVK
jgi:hypothetical protein